MYLPQITELRRQKFRSTEENEENPNWSIRQSNKHRAVKHIEDSIISVSMKLQMKADFGNPVSAIWNIGTFPKPDKVRGCLPEKFADSLENEELAKTLRTFVNNASPIVTSLITFVKNHNKFENENGMDTTEDTKRGALRDLKNIQILMDALLNE